MNKGQLIKQLTDKFFLRFHMSLILSLTVLSGYISTKTLYYLGLTNLTTRYSLSFLISYLIFFLCIRIWLYYIFSTRNNSKNDSDWDLWDFDTWFISSGKKVSSPYKGSGGKFSGGGASSSFESADAKSPMLAAIASPSDGKSALKISDLDLDGDAAPLVVVLLVLGLILIAVGALFYLIFNAPMVLGEIAFQLALSIGVLKSADRKTGPFSWLETAFSKTWLMALFILILIVSSTLTINHYKPEITKSSEIKEWILGTK